MNVKQVKTMLTLFWLIASSFPALRRSAPKVTRRRRHTKYREATKNVILRFTITLHSNLPECRCVKGLRPVEGALHPTLTLTSPYTDGIKDKVPVTHYSWQSMLLTQAISPTGTDCQFAAYGIRVLWPRKNSCILASSFTITFSSWQVRGECRVSEGSRAPSTGLNPFTHRHSGRFECRV